jgi:AmiR/NasT family two-component response regulator
MDEPTRILIAEDETIIRLDLKQLLEEHGFVVCGEARDGLEAVALARELQPDLAVLDMRMPELDGIEAARRIYAERPLPIVMITAYSDRPLVERAIAAGIFAYLTKPFRAGDVVPAIRAATARHTELLAARREIAGAPGPLQIELRSPAGNVYPLRVERRADGTVDVALAPELRVEGP